MVMINQNFRLSGDFNPNKTKEELKNIGIMVTPYVDYSIIISDDFNGNNMGSEKNTKFAYR